MEKENENKLGETNPARVMIKRIQENKNSLHISRVPPKTIEEFTALANEEFLGDYGMALKWLMDGIPKQDMRLVLVQLASLHERVEALENSSTETGEVTSPETTKLPKTFGNKRENRNGKKPN
jgi:hypothetical protein